MNVSVFARVFTLASVAAAAVAQQPSPAAPPTPPTSLTSPRNSPSTFTGPPSSPAAAETNVAPDAVVLTIGDQKMTRAEFELLLAALAQNGHPAATPAAKRQVAEQYGELETMAQEARKRKLDQNPEVKQMMSVQGDSFLANTLAKRVADDSHFTDLDLRSYYDSHKSEFDEAKGSHILIRFKGSAVPLKPNQKELTPEEALAKAQDIRKKIIAGGDFAALAKTESDDTASAVKGGELGAFKHGQMVGPFDQAAFSIPVGEVSEPVKTQFGYHIIKITSRSTVPFEEAKPQIEKELKPKLAKEALEKVKAETPVTLNDQYFGKESPGSKDLPAGPHK